MEEQNDLVVEEQEGIEPEVEEQGPSPEELEAQKEAQEEARKYGWKPKEEFTLAPEGWVDADRFLELPSTQNKVLRDMNRNLSKAVEETKKEAQERFERLERTNRMAMERAIQQEKDRHKTELANVRAAQRKAVDDGDLETYDSLEKREIELLSNPPSEPELADPQESLKAQAAQEVTAYRSTEDGKWLNNPMLARQAYEVIEYTPGAKALDTMGQIQLAKQSLEGMYPHLFPKQAPAGRTQTKVDGGGLASSSGSKGVNSLPAEALKVGKEFVSDGIYKTLEDYAKDYWAEG